MFIYQSVIMALVAVAIYFLAILFKAKRKKFLVVIMAAVLIVGLISLYFVQYYFSNHYYTQELNTATIQSIKFDNSKADNLKSTLSDFDKTSDSDSNSEVYNKIYNVEGNGGSSTIEANIYLFTNNSDADNYFKAEQNLYENKNYIPLDLLKSKKKGDGTLYLISGIKSQYRDYTEILYLPSKIDYHSDLLIKSSNMIISLTETSNKPVTNKEQILKDISSKLS